MKRKKAKKKRARTSLITVPITLGSEHAAYVREIAEYACVKVEVVCAVLLGCGIFQAKRYQLPKYQALETKLARCREIMEANDPLNARDIFGPPADAPTPPEAPPQPPPEGATP